MSVDQTATDERLATRGLRCAQISWIVGVALFAGSFIVDWIVFPDGGHMGERYAFDHAIANVLFWAAAGTAILNTLAIGYASRALVRTRGEATAPARKRARYALAMGLVGYLGSFLLASLALATGLAYI